MAATNGLKAFTVALVLLAIAFGSGFSLLFRLGYAVLFLVFLALIWTLVNMVGLELRRETREQRAQAGQSVEERLTLRNRFLLPKIWLEVRDRSTLPNHRASRAFALGPNGQRGWVVRTLCRRRGKYYFGPVTISTGDPFGLFRCRRHWPEVRQLLVVPCTVDLPRFAIPLGHLPGGNALRQRSNAITPNSLGIRPYVPGDSLNRIHWRSTARLGSLTVKEFELDPLSDIWVVLDGAHAVQEGWGDESTEEYGVIVAASLIKHFLDKHRPVGLIAYSARPSVLPADRGPRQLARAMDELALFRSIGRTPLAEVLAAESPRFGRNTTLIAITPSLSVAWVQALRHASQRGVRGVAVFLEPDTFGGGQQSADIMEALDDARLPVFLVKRGSNLAEALALPASGRGR